MRSSSAIDRRRALGLLALAAFGIEGAARPGRGASTADDPAESIDIAGRPDAKTVGDESRLVFWRDLKEGNLHVQAVARGAQKEFRGKVVAVGGAIRDVEGLETLESAKKSRKGGVKNATSADRVTWKKDTLDFNFHTNGGKTDEITIRITPETTHLKLTFTIDNKHANDQIFLGKAGAHPSADVFVVPLER